MVASLRTVAPRSVLFVVLFMLLTLMPAWAQSSAPLELTLGSAIDLARRNGPQTAIIRQQFAQSRWDNRSFHAQYLPQLSLTGNAPGFQRSINDILQDNGDIRYVEQRQTSSSVNLQLSQQIPLTGGTVFVASGLNRLELLGDFDRSEWRTSPLRLGVSQPLFRFNQQKWTRRTEPLRFEVAQKRYVEDLEEVSVDITSAFFDVFIAEMNVDIATFNVAVNDTVYTLSKGRFDIGRIAENDLLQSELALLNAQTSLSDAQIAYERALQNLKTDLGLSPTAELIVVPPTTIPELTLQPQDAVGQARSNRSAFLNLELQALQAERDLSQARLENGFTADLSASYGLNQTASSFSDAYTDPLNQQALSVNFQVPVFQWGRRKAEVQSALAAQEEIELTIAQQQELLDQETYFEAVQLLQQQQQVALAAKADTIATRRFEVARSRYLIGNIDITDLFDAQREKDTARRSYFQTLRQFWVSYFRLRNLTLYDFVENRRLSAVNE